MYIVGYVGNNSVSSYHLHASETQQLANASSICVELLGGSCQSLTDQLTRHPITQWLKDRINYLDQRRLQNRKLENLHSL